MNQLRTIVLLTALAALLVVIGGVIGGKNGATIALVIAIVMNFGSYWFSDKIVLSMYQAQEVTEAEAPDLYHLVQQLADRAGLPMPRVYIIPDDSPNAFATGRNPSHAAVAVTEGILRLLSWEELAGVIGHELGHVKNRDILIQSVAATIGAAVTYLAQFGFLFGGRSDDEERGSIIGTILMMILAPLAAAIIQMAISRSREYMADDTGAQICDHPLWLASALDKLRRGSEAIPMHANQATAHMFIVSPLFGGGLASLFSTHPPIEERIARLQHMAGY
ncbi:zinc metalloprotease HtpX [Desulfomonile tiedjei]|uniref:Protease HtpX homolog n=1 Tax=Desulfomonile tiedjei (strain ATCC 49306 / DSM 6799 / DCB-1) TaxID=706587 RepID=I4CB41_DESTA|nr:zinc metalloprotease HtpX [Desulfomonile tiedjei]AFM26782.1 Heat shock protein [Desulfomonile tiedjei DSM 6799]